MRRFAGFLVALLAAGLLGALGACTGDPQVQVPTAATGPGRSTSTASVSPELQFVACMRAQGVADMPDPIPGDTSGRSAVRYALDVLGKGSDEGFQSALDKCQHLLPTVDTTKGPSSALQQKYLAFARCMRDHGVTDFPDDVTFVGNSPALFFGASPNDPKMFTAGSGSVAVNLANPTTKAAYDACQGEWQKLIA